MEFENVYGTAIEKTNHRLKNIGPRKCYKIDLNKIEEKFSEDDFC